MLDVSIERKWRQNCIKKFVKKYGEFKGRLLAKKHLRLYKYKRKGQYRNGTYYCKRGIPITKERIFSYENMCHKLVRSFFPALALYEASLNYDDLVAQCRIEVFLALLDSFDPKKAMLSSNEDPEKRKQIEEEKRKDPEKTLERLEKNIVYGRIINYLRRVRWRYHPSQLGGVSVDMENYSPYLKSEKAAIIDINKEIEKDKDKLFHLYETRGEKAVRKYYRGLPKKRREALVEDLREAA